MENAAHFLPLAQRKIFVTGRTGVCVPGQSARLETEQRSAPLRASDPPSWKNFEAQHREVLTIPREPPGNGRMLLKMEKDVNARLRCLGKVFAPSSYSARKSDAKTDKKALARGVSYGRLASFAPHSCDSRDCKRYQSGEGREIHSGGRAAWASLFSWSSG
jgi:hypothetical protein